jgi:hypothetical protein
MSTSRPFAYNPGSPIPGTDQYGDLAVGVLDEPYADNYGGVIWWEGPDEDLGYVIAVSVPDNSQPTPIFGVTASVGFYRSEFYTEASYIEVANAVSGQNFTSGNQAAAWLLSNGYWTSWPGSGPTTSPTPTPTSTSTPAPTNTSIPVTPTNTATPSPTASQFAVTPTPTQTGTPTPTGASVLNITLLEVGGNVVMSGAGTMNITSLGSPQSYFRGSTIAPAAAQFGCGTAGAGPFNCSIFTGGTIFQPANFGTGGQTNGDSVTGDFFGIGFDGTDRRLFVPTGYVSGSFISGTTTFNSTTLATLGATPGTYTWSWGSGANASSIVMTIGTNSVTPTPTSTSTNTPTPSVTNTQTPTTTPTVTPTSTTTPTPTHSAPSGLSITIVESGGNVVMSASGSLNINDLILVSPSTGPYGGGGLGVSTATFLMGTTGVNYALYSGFTTTPSNFGPGGAGGGSTSTSGDVFGVIFQGAPPYELVVPVGYTTGTAISSTQTFNSASFASLGLTPGTYSYTWGSGANADSINVVVGGGGVTPTPTQTSQTPTPTPTSGATGDFTVTVSQVGPDVIWNGSGKFNLTALTSAGTNTIGGGYAANQAIWAVGPTTTVDTYSGTITYPTSFGTGGAGVTSNTGATFGILPGGSGRILYVPVGYTSNTTISGTSTYANQTISGMGLTPGTYTWSWGSGGNASTLVMTITP